MVALVGEMTALDEISGVVVSEFLAKLHPNKNPTSSFQYVSERRKPHFRIFGKVASESNPKRLLSSMFRNVGRDVSEFMAKLHPSSDRFLR